MIELFDSSPSAGWRSVACEALADYRDARAIRKLCEVLLNDSDPNVRFVAAESLAVIGDETAIGALEHAMDHDDGEDYEGFPISDAARQALERIRGRSGHS